MPSAGSPATSPSTPAPCSSSRPRRSAAVGLSPDVPVPPIAEPLRDSGKSAWQTRDRGPAGGVPPIYHVMSPFEAELDLEEIWPPWSRGSRLVVTLYDLIPLIMRERYNADWGYMATAWIARLGLLGSAQQILTISQQTADDAMEHLNVPEERITVIDSGRLRPLLLTRQDAGAGRLDPALGAAQGPARLPALRRRRRLPQEPRGRDPRLRRAARADARRAPARHRLQPRRPPPLQPADLRPPPRHRVAEPAAHRLRLRPGPGGALPELRALRLPLALRGRGPPDPRGDDLRRARRVQQHLGDAGAARRPRGDLRPGRPRGHRTLHPRGPRDAREARRASASARAGGSRSTPGSGWRGGRSRATSGRSRCRSTGWSWRCREARPDHRHQRAGRQLPRRAPAREGLRGPRPRPRLDRPAASSGSSRSPTGSPSTPATCSTRDRWSTCCADSNPDEVYNLAAMSSVAESWRLAVATAEYTAVGVTRLLEGIREACPEARFYQASSSEMFGRARETPQSETHALLPAQPLRRRQGLRPLHHRQLPRELRPPRELRDPLQPRISAARRLLRHAPDQRRGGEDQARPRGRARARQPRGAPRLGIRQGVRRGDVADAPAGRARRLRDRDRGRRTRSRTSSTPPSPASA